MWTCFFLYVWENVRFVRAIEKFLTGFQIELFLTVKTLSRNAGRDCFEAICNPTNNDLEATGNLDLG